MKKLQQKKSYINIIIEKILSNISLSLTLWIFANFDCFMVIVAYFINKININ